MSRPIQPSGTSIPSSARAGASAEKLVAITRSLGSSRRACPSRPAAASAARAGSIPSGSHSDAPTSWPERGEEREAHRAADEDGVGDLQEALDHADLVGHLRAADDGHERAPRVLEDRAQRAHLALEQAPGGGGEQVGHALGAGVGAVGACRRRR